ncbi:Hsp20/alpha crystallin family protein [Ornithinibacillus contaminans]|uniref:Hsp20/alpha crystallin family protein n=1 Tax=Ornithinibacillus contaminans TaxID=694055 RepID=UPI00064DDD6F|nr:Hsp20/alpha crystallin family protein [Ornithinibacillus contaminans]
MSSRKNRLPNRFDIDMTPLHDFMKQMDSFFHHSFKQMNEQFHLNPFWVDVKENNTHFIIEADIAGYDRDQVQIEVIGNRLRIGLEENEIIDEKNTETNYRHRKQFFNRKERFITLPFEIPKQETKASYRQNTLYITIPKQNSTRSFIEIEDS